MGDLDLHLTYFSRSQCKILLARQLQISFTDLHTIWPNDASHHSLGWVRWWVTLTYIWPTFLGRNAKSRYRDNFRFLSPICTQFDPVMHPTIALDEFEDEDEWPSHYIWPTFLGSNAHNLHTIWPSDASHHSLGWVRRCVTLTYTVDLLFWVAMQNLMVNLAW